ncbi:hypothetical protein ABZX77_22375 [Streptomyces sp. NPDC004237]|uniref:hypothetical protein n=1 Tax=Streptomyces sp. NPDC004237 TaxID=3154455 RepID=UPI0033B8F87D
MPVEACWALKDTAAAVLDVLDVVSVPSTRLPSASMVTPAGAPSSLRPLSAEAWSAKVYRPVSASPLSVASGGSVSTPAVVV